MWSLSALAVDIELGLGGAHYTTRGDMMWYQEGLPHKRDLNAPTYEASLVGTAWQSGAWSMDWRASFLYVGNVHSDAMAVADEDYNRFTKTCLRGCDTAARFVGNGHQIGVRLTVAPTYTYNGWRMAPEGGLYIYRPTWHEVMYTVYGGSLNVNGTTHWQLAPVIGASIGYGAWSVAYLHYFSKTLNDPYHAIWKATDTITLRYRF